ncbi:LuxR C-terminal-related transcriptional regulator [Streptomyces sp. NPDC093225]|uniref:helix-turn-helix transcriptional regulator n=1 Tax=Streptomyces sp. NPDC093225 TaxID=3366034 RepID=UPI003802E6F3
MAQIRPRTQAHAQARGQIRARPQDRPCPPATRAAARPLAERDEVLRAAAEATAAARAGRGGWLLLRAPAGRGRTAVLDEVVRRETRDGSVLARRAQSAAEESGFPFALVRQLFPVTDDRIPFDAPDAGHEERAFHRLVARLAGAGEAGSGAPRPVLLAVDDVQHADAVSRRWLGYLARRVAGLPVVLLLTECGDPSDVTWLPRAGGAVHTLPPLGPDAVAALAAGHGLDADRARTCAAASAGNPALVQALLADLAEGPLPRPAGSAAGSRYRDRLVHWLRNRADEPSRRFCLALAALARGEPAASSVARVAALLPESEVPPAATAGRLAQVFAHPLAHEAALAAARPDELAALHTGIARRLHERGAPAAVVAARLLLLDRPGAPWMVHALEEAADEAARHGRTAGAASLLRHALRGSLDPGRRAALTLRLGAWEFPHSADAGIRSLRAGLELHPDRRESAAAAPALGAALVARGRTDTALRVLDQARSGADDDLVHVLRAVTALVSSHDATAWRHAVAGLRALASTAPAPVEPLVCGLITEYEVGAGLVPAAEAVARVRARLSSPVHPGVRTAWLGSAATLLQWADRLDEVRALVDGCLPAAPVPPDLTDVGVQCLLSVRAEAALWAGDFRRVLAENVPLVADCTARGVRLPHLVAMVALAHHELGASARARAMVTAAGAAYADSSWEWNELRYARARLHADSGDWQAALDDYLACGAGQDARDFVSPVATPWRSGAALALAALGRTARARELAAEELRHARDWGTARTVARALYGCAAAAGGRPALDLLAEAAGLLADAPAPVERVETLIALGRARIGAGLGRRGREDLREAHAQALALVSRGGAEDPVPAAGRLVRAAEEALGLANARRAPRARTGRDALTAAEWRVVELAVQGRTNAEICDGLHLARRTVETHLTSAYRKLDVASRTQLAARLGGAGAAPPD